MRLVPLVWMFLALVGCGSVSLVPDADATAAPSQRGTGGAHDAAAATSAPAPPGGCGKMCQSGNGDNAGMGKHGGQTCDKSPCSSDDPG